MFERFANIKLNSNNYGGDVKKGLSIITLRSITLITDYIFRCV